MTYHLALDITLDIVSKNASISSLSCHQANGQSDCDNYNWKVFSNNCIESWRHISTQGELITIKVSLISWTGVLRPHINYLSCKLYPLRSMLKLLYCKSRSLFNAKFYDSIQSLAKLEHVVECAMYCVIYFGQFSVWFYQYSTSHVYVSIIYCLLVVLRLRHMFTQKWS